MNVHPARVINVIKAVKQQDVIALGQFSCWDAWADRATDERTDGK